MPTDPTKFRNFLEKGAIYFSGRLDRAGLQPVIVMDTKKFIDLDIGIEDFENCLKYIFNLCE